MKKVSFLLIISLLFLNACATKTKKFNTQKENCKEIYVYFTQSKDCLGLNFQTYYEEKNKEFERSWEVSNIRKYGQKIEERGTLEAFI